MKGSRTVKRERDALGVPGRNHSLYSTWQGMKDRCNNPNSPAYVHYGGRGISICDQWSRDFAQFYFWAIESGWQQGLQIDRIDNNGPYEPDNCRWVTHQQNQNNRRNGVRMEYNGAYYSPRELFEMMTPCVPFHVFHDRITHGWEIDLAATTPRRKYTRLRNVL